MARYLVERTFPDGLNIPTTPDGAETCLSVVGENAEVRVTTLHSYVNENKSRTTCVQDGPNPDSIRRAATRNGLPVDKITRVRVLDPYFYL